MRVDPEKDLEAMSSADLYALAKAREAEERGRKQSEIEKGLKAIQEERKSLREHQRKEVAVLMRRYKKEIRDLEKEHVLELESLDKRRRDLETVLGIRTQRNAESDSAGSLEILEVMQPGKEYRAADIRKLLAAKGKTKTTHLSQKINYLVKTERVVAPRKGFYRIEG